MTDNPYEPPAGSLSAPKPGAAYANRGATASFWLGLGSIPLYVLPPACIGMAVASIVLGIRSGDMMTRPARAYVGMTCAVVGLALTTFLLVFILSFPLPRFHR